MKKNPKPLVLVTGASGNIGAALCRSLERDYRFIGLDKKPSKEAFDSIECDLTSADSTNAALEKLRKGYGHKLAAVIHLAAYFDFTGKDSPLYAQVNVKGTEHLLEALHGFEVGRFIYASTMLVHEAACPGKKITEETALGPKWAYPQSKLETEEIIRAKHGRMPYTILRLAGVYSDETAVPTLSCQIARIYEREAKSHLYAGDQMAGQSFIHQEDMVDLFARVLEKRAALPRGNAILAGEDSVMGYRALQNRIGALVFGEEEWKTIGIPPLIAKAGAKLEWHMEPLMPDSIDRGKKPFILPFMIDMASDHYDLDIARARELLGWRPRHNIHDGLAKLVGNLKKDPLAWYEKNQIVPPDWVNAAPPRSNADRLRSRHEAEYRRLHRENLWAPFMNMGLALWLMTSPATLGYSSGWLAVSDIGSGILLLVLSFLSLSWQWGMARWAAAAVGFWLLSAPLVFWADSAAAYLNGTLVGMLVMAFAVLWPPVPGISPVAAGTGPAVPQGWGYSPSSWLQRLPVIGLAFIGFFVSRYLAAYQLGHVDGIWEPFFAGARENPRNGTEEIITSSVSQAWPVPDAGLGALTYALEILTGMIGASNRWRTMPWLVILFGILIIPLGVVSITFIIIQPIIIGTWCTLCLIAAAAMLLQIPYSIDEVVATVQFMMRRKKAGRPLLLVFFRGDTDKGTEAERAGDFEQPPLRVLKNAFSGGVSFPPNLVLCILLGIWLMFTRITLGAGAEMADADHLIGALVITIAVTAMADMARIVRYLIMPLGAALLVTPFIYGAGDEAAVASIICGVLLMAASYGKGRVAGAAPKTASRKQPIARAAP